MKGGEIIGQIIDSGIERSRVVVLAGNIDFASSAERIVLAFDFQLINLQLSSPQIQLRCQTIDASFEKGEGGALNFEMSAKFAIASVHCSLDGDLPAKIVRACAEQTDKIAKLVDRCGNIAAKIRAKPARRVSGECGLAA